MFKNEGTRPRYMVALSDGITSIGEWQSRNVMTTAMGNVTLNGPEVFGANSLMGVREMFQRYAIATGREDVPTDSEQGYGGPSAHVYDARSMDALDDPYSAITPDSEPVYRVVIGPRGGFRVVDMDGALVL